MAFPDETLPASMRRILEAVAQSPRWARAVLADLLQPGADEVGAAKAEYDKACADDAALRDATGDRKPVFPGDDPYPGSAAAQAVEAARNATEPPPGFAHGDRTGIHPLRGWDLNGNRLPHGRLHASGNTGSAVLGVAREYASWLRWHTAAMEAERRKYHKWRAEALDAALDVQATDGETPVAVVEVDGQLWAVAVGQEKAVALAMKHGYRDRKPQDKVEMRNPLWAVLWKRAGERPAYVHALKAQLLEG